jgi:microcystin-dependent protein
MIAFFSNLYKNNPIQFFMMIAIIYLLLNQTKVVENLKTDQVDLTAISTVSQLAQRMNKALDIDSHGNVTFKKSINIIPRGTILAWNSPTAPAGWALCDGQNGTPDLRGRFIRMQNNHGGDQRNHWAYQVQDLVTVGRNKMASGASLTNHKTWMREHAFNDRGGTDVMVLDGREMPSHHHTMPRPVRHWGRSFKGAGGSELPLINHGGSLYFDKTNNTGSSWGHNNMPPYYVLSYIMKL